MTGVVIDLAAIVDRYRDAPAPIPTGPVARATDPGTSHDAGREVAANPVRLFAQQLVVLATIPGVFDEPNRITDGHGAIRAQIHPGSFAKRRKELADHGLVTCTGEGLSPYGRRAMLWTRTPEGERYLTSVLKNGGVS